MDGYQGARGGRLVDDAALRPQAFGQGLWAEFLQHDDVTGMFKRGLGGGIDQVFNQHGGVIEHFLSALAMLIWTNPYVMFQVLGVLVLVVIPALWFGRRESVR